MVRSKRHWQKLHSVNPQLKNKGTRAQLLTCRSFAITKSSFLSNMIMGVSSVQNSRILHHREHTTHLLVKSIIFVYSLKDIPSNNSQLSTHSTWTRRWRNISCDSDGSEPTMTACHSCTKRHALCTCSHRIRRVFHICAARELTLA